MNIFLQFLRDIVVTLVNVTAILFFKRRVENGP